MPPAVRLHTIAISAVACAAALALPSSAAAQGYTCEASAFSGSVLTSPAEAPVTANRGQACRTAGAGGSAPPSPLPLTLAGLSAETRLDGPADRVAEQTAFAAGGLTDIRVRSLPALPFALPRPSFSDLQAVSVPGVGTVDLRPALEALLPAQQLPDRDLVRVQGARAEVTGRCTGGAPRLESSASVSRLTVNGVDLGVDRAVTETVTLIDSQSIDPSDVDISKIVGPIPGVDLTPLAQQIQPVLDALPPIAIPATVAHINVTPGRRTESPGRVTHTAMYIVVTIGGQNLANLTVGEATVGAAGVSCAGGVADLALACTSRRVVLIDVERRAGRVRLLGAAARSLAGERVAIRFTASGRTVARPRVGADGLFRATAPLPAKALRNTDRARYQAVIGSDRSLRLKLARRMLVTSTRVSGGRVSIAGRVLRPLGSPVQTVVVERRLSCGRYEVVRRFKPRRDGRFSIRLAGPQGSEAAVYRMRTRVRKRAGNPKMFPTFTLPRFVELT